MKNSWENISEKNVLVSLLLNVSFDVIFYRRAFLREGWERDFGLPLFSVRPKAHSGAPTTPLWDLCFSTLPGFSLFLLLIPQGESVRGLMLRNSTCSHCTHTHSTHTILFILSVLSPLTLATSP